MDKKSLIGKGKNVSVRRLQMSGLSKPQGPGPQGNLQMSARPWKKLAKVEDWDQYKKRPVDVVLLKDLELHAATLDKLKHRLRDADDEDLEILLGLTAHIASDKAPLYIRLQELVAERKTIVPALEAALAPVVDWARDFLAAIGTADEARSFCARFVEACKNEDAAAVMLTLVEIGFPAEDYTHVLAPGKAIDPTPSGSGLSLAAAFGHGFAHAVSPAEPSPKALDQRAVQAYIIGVVAGHELEPASREPLMPHAKLVRELLEQKLTDKP